MAKSLLFAGLLAVSTSSVAFAQGDDALPTEPAFAPSGDFAPIAFWPQAVVDRPYVRPKKTFALYGGLVYRRTVTAPNPPGSPDGDTNNELGLLAGGAFGITDDLNLGLQYSFALAEFDIEGPLTVFGNYQLIQEPRMSVAANADVTFNLGGNAVTTGGMTSTATGTTIGMHAGLGARYNATPRVALFTGAPFGPGPFGQHLQVDFERETVDFSLPFGIGFQALPNYFAWLGTNLTTIHFNPGDNQDTIEFIGDAFIPLELGGLYALSETLDIGTTFSDDLKNFGDSFRAMLFVRYYGGI